MDGPGCNANERLFYTPNFGGFTYLWGNILYVHREMVDFDKSDNPLIYILYYIR